MFDDGNWPAGGGHLVEHNRYSGPDSGASVIRGVWDINQRIVGRVTRRGGQDALLAFDLEFNPITLSTLPEGSAVPEGRYDFIHDGQDIGDYVVETAGLGTGEITWPGAQSSCALMASPIRRSRGTTRNVWDIAFIMPDMSCPPTFGVGYAEMVRGKLVFQIVTRRQGNNPIATEGEADLMHLQLRQR